VPTKRVVVSGLPGSGKSTLARMLAARLGFPIFDKDDHLERLFDLPEFTATSRSGLSRLADSEFIRAVISGTDAVVVSFWRREQLSPSSGTPFDWLSDSAIVVEVFCECSPSAAATRFRARRRHERHEDDRRNTEALDSQFDALAALGPLGIGPLVKVNTEQPIDLDFLALAVRHALTEQEQ
jgi:gluconate kinase